MIDFPTLLYTPTCEIPTLKKKRLNYALSYDFGIFKGMSHNLELLSFKKMLVC